MSIGISRSTGSRAIRLLVALALAFPVVFVSPGPAVAAGATTCVSISTGGVPGDSESRNPVMSPDGRYVVFESRATDLVAGGTSGTLHIFWHDRDTGQTELVSKSTGGAEANSNSFNATVSADGRYVAFQSVASNLVAPDTGAQDVFIRDRVGGTTERVSVAINGGEANVGSQNPMISADGRFVAFDSSATDLVTGDGNQSNDVFLRDLGANTTTRVSVTNTGAQATGGGSRNPSISADGRYVAFESEATNLVSVASNGYKHIYRRDRTGATTTRVSVTGASTQGNSDSQNPAISGNGLVIAFETFATNLGGSNPAAYSDVIVREGTSTTRVNRSSSGELGNGLSQRPSLSYTGRYVAFDASSTNLVSLDANGSDDVFVRDRTAGTTSLMSMASGGAQGDGHSTFAAISGDGLIVAFQSLATNLVGGDANTKLDVFVNARAIVPTGTITINSGAPYTNTLSVTAAHTASAGVTQMRHSTNGGSTWSPWEPYSATKTVTLLPGDGEKSVRVQFRGGDDTESAVYLDTIIL
ncbi:MAG: hypothetical protein P1P71_06580, partial [Anaerosomatales bacterium]|nr:hypothetical protein [Anaerosomatales bacterium]